MKQKELETIKKLAWNTIDHSSTLAQQNVANLVARGDLKIDRAVLPTLLKLIKDSVEQGYQQMQKPFVDGVSKVLNDLSEDGKKK